MSEGDSGDIGIQDAIRLKHEMNGSIKYGGCYAKEITDLAGLDEGGRDSLNKNLAHIKKVWWVFPDWLMSLGFFVAGAFLFFLQSVPARLVCLLALIYFATQFTYRMGIYFGFTEGFREGHEEGAHRALGISQDEAMEISERATEMEMDDRLIAKLDQGKD